MFKADLRKQFLEKRKELTEIQFQELNKSLCSNVEKYIQELTRPLTIASFLPIAAKHEIETAQIHEDITRMNGGHTFCFPRVMNGIEMQFFKINSANELVLSKWGIPEPMEDIENLIKPQEIQLMFIPLLAFDKKGHRVGYGKGFYDQYLAQCSNNLIKIGLSLFEEFSEIDDVELTDIPLDIIITPAQLCRVGTM